MKKFILIIIAVFSFFVVSCSEEKLPEPDTQESLTTNSEGDDGEDPIIQD